MTTIPSPTRTERSFYEFDGFRLDPVRRRLLRAGHPVPLTPKAFSILLALIEKRGEVMEKEELIQRVWPDSYVTEANLTQNISSLRKALGERANDHRYVVTVPGRGYSFVADVLEVPREQTGEHAITPVTPDPGPLPATPTPLTPLELRPVPTPSDGFPALDETGTFRLPVSSGERPFLPPRGRRRFLLAGLLLGFLLAASTVGLYIYIKERDTPPADAGKVNARPVVAVLGFRNLSGNPDQGWLSTALAEMLITELSTGSEIRMVTGEEIYRARGSLALSHSQEPSEESLQRVHEVLGADMVVVGTYLSVGKELRIDLRVLRASDGEALASLADVGTEDELFNLVSRVGRKVRQTLNLSQPSPQEMRASQARQPRNPEATRLYVEGLTRLRAFDSQGATTLLEKAAAKDTESAVIRSALSLAWMGVGNDAEARQQAAEALRLSAALPKHERLATEARLAEAEKNWNKAAEIYRSLWTFYPDNLEHGLSLVTSLSAAGRNKEALSFVDQLRKLPAPHGEDPRIDLAEAQVAKRLSSFVVQMHSAKTAEEKGRRSGQNLVVAQALTLQGDGLFLVGRPQEAIPLFGAARELFERSGNQGAVATLLTRLGRAYHAQGNLAKAEETYQSSMTMLRQVGSGQGMALQVANLGLLFQDQGDLLRARKFLDEAYEDFNQEGDRVLAARTLNAIGTLRVSAGDLAGGRRNFEAVLATSRQTGSRADEARALYYLGLVQAHQGLWKEALRRQEGAYKISMALQDPSRAAMMLAAQAEAQVRLGDLPAARRSFTQALAMKQRAQDKIGVAEIHGALAWLEYRQGNLAKAKEHSQTQLRLAQGIGSRGLVAAALQTQSLWRMEEGDSEGAWRTLDEVARERAGMGDTMQAATARLAQATASLRQGHLKEAERIAAELVAWYEARQMTGHQARALALQAQALLRQGQVKQAEPLAIRAYSLCQHNEDNELRIEIFAAVAPVGAATDSARDAVGHLRWAVSEARRIGYVAAGFEAQLMLGVLQTQTGDAINGRATLKDVQRDAAARGYHRLAQEAATYLEKTQTKIPRPRGVG